MLILKVDPARGESNAKILDPGVTNMDFTIEFSYLPCLSNFLPPNSSAIITNQTIIRIYGLGFLCQPLFPLKKKRLKH